jgi:hypothetical protein
MRLLRMNPKIGIIASVLVFALPLLEGSAQVFAILALPIILLHERGYIKMERDVSEKSPYPRLTKYIYYIYYPLHLSILYLIKTNA